MVRYFIGVSGFSYPSWKGKFYPDKAKPEEFLSIYASRLATVEVNSSFYAPPGAATVKNWEAKTGKEFRFAFKAPRMVTHILKLGKGSAESAAKFSATVELLGEKRGPVLFQLPPFSKEDHKLLEDFLTKTSDIKPKVFEFRHESWLNDSTFKLLEKHGAGFCIAETEDMQPTFKVTGGIAYFRLRKDVYDAKAVDRWAETIKKTSEASPECYVFLRHDETGENALFAERLRGLLA